jgi:hypothetical protein
MRGRLAVLSFLALALVVCRPCAFADETSRAKVENVLLQRGEDGDMLVDFAVTGTIDKKLVETLDSGLPVRLVFEIRVVRAAKFLMGGVISYSKFERVLEKDNLKNRYRVTIGDDYSDFGSLAEAMAMMVNVTDISVVQLSDLLRDERYRMEILVKLEEFRLPFFLHRVLPFFGYWDVTTPVSITNVPKDFSRQP